MTDKPRNRRGPAPQRDPSELAALLAAMSEEEGEAPRPALRRPEQPQGQPPEPEPREPAPEPQPPARETPTVLGAPEPQPPAAAPQPPPDTPTVLGVPERQPPAPAPQPPEPQPPAAELQPPETPTVLGAPEPPAPPARPESDVIAGKTLVPGVPAPLTGAPDFEPEPGPYSLEREAPPPRPRSRASGRAYHGTTAGRKPPRAQERRRRPTGRGLEPPRTRSRRRELLRLTIVGATLLVLAIIAIALVGNRANNNQTATPPPSNPATRASTLPRPSTTTATQTSTVTSPSTTTPASAPDVATPKGLGVTGLVIPQLSATSPAPKALAGAHPALAIVDPADGPGAHPQAAVRARIGALRSDKTRLLGYVPSDDGHRAPGAVLSDLAHYSRWYGVRDVVLGQTPTGAGALGAYRHLVQSLHRHGAQQIVFDPGAVPARGYFSIANAVVTFAGPQSAYEHAPVPRWLQRLGPDRQLNLISAASTALRAQLAITIARQRKVGLVYVTSGRGPNAFAGSPNYLAHEHSWLQGRAG